MNNEFDQDNEPNSLSQNKVTVLSNLLTTKFFYFLPEIVFMVVSVINLVIFVLFQNITDVYLYYEVSSMSPVPFLFDHDFSWAYPPLSFFPILIPNFFPGSYEIYIFLWYLMVFLMDFGVVKVLKKKWNQRNIFSPKSKTFSYFLFSPSILFSVSLLCLGPISIFELDSFTLPLLILALIYLDENFSLSIFLINFCGWIKIFAFFYLIPIFLLTQKKIKIIIYSSIFPLVFIFLAFTISSFDNVFEFLLFFQNRGIQSESLFASPFLILDLFTGKNSNVFDNFTLSDQIIGDIPEIIAPYLSYLLYIGILILALLTYKFYRPRENTPSASESIICLLCLDFWLVSIIFNKVGSPQYYCLLIVPILVGLLFQDPEFDNVFKLLASISLIILLFTLITDLGYYYWQNLSGLPAIIFRSILVLRNCLDLYLFYKVNKILFWSRNAIQFERTRIIKNKSKSPEEL